MFILRGHPLEFEMEARECSHRQSRTSVCTVSDAKRRSTRCLSMVMMFSWALCEVCRCDSVPRVVFVLTYTDLHCAATPAAHLSSFLGVVSGVKSALRIGY